MQAPDDLVVLGSGPAGEKGAVQAVDLGHRVAVSALGELARRS